ncbi:STAS domain-containing protein [Rhodosalinus sp. FB01]|uniref:STAS domain-containing protein n=1 Tax=Rhodosalinus sp. FB01 TaxID=3239194 RepID=UPI0035235EB8
MEDTAIAPPPPRRLALPARMDPTAAEELSEALEHLRGIPVQLDGAAVQQAGGLCLQLLVIAARQWREDGLAFGLTDRSEALEEALALLDLARVLGSDRGEDQPACH